MVDYAIENPAFASVIQITEPTDPAHADNVNHAPKQIFGNTLVLKALHDSLVLVVNAANAAAHNAIYRGKNLGTSITAAQWAAIKNGTFDDMYIGDYWTINNIVYRIAAFDYWLNTGDTQCTTHHVILVPDACIGNNKKMNDSNITTGGYVGSKMYTEYMADAKTVINTAFSGHILSHREYLVNAMTNGKPSAGAWYDSTIELMNERMVYGCPVFEVANDGTTVPTLYTIDKSQLPLFALDPSRITNRADWWLRDPVSAAYFALVSAFGHAHSGRASNSYGVRPAFGIYQS